MTAPQLSNGVRAALHLRRLRIRLGRTQKDLAKQMGTTRQTIARWETGTAPLNVEQIKDLCLALKCTTEQLLDRNNGIEERHISPSANSETEIRYGTYKVKTTVGIRQYPIDENSRASILCQLKIINRRRANHNNKALDLRR
ncbi:XRE family transcriptional regulator [Mesorhizobium sp. USDA-HM6]|nr:XRE family transcriptional regulator [Mesorhizobium sp. USDA-HM6]